MVGVVVGDFVFNVFNHRVVEHAMAIACRADGLLSKQSDVIQPLPRDVPAISRTVSDHSLSFFCVFFFFFSSSTFHLSPSARRVTSGVCRRPAILLATRQRTDCGRTRPGLSGPQGLSGPHGPQHRRCRQRARGGCHVSDGHRAGHGPPGVRALLEAQAKGGWWW